MRQSTTAMVTCAVLLVLTTAACAPTRASFAEGADLADLFYSVEYDYDPTGSGAELADIASVAIRAQITDLSGRFSEIVVLEDGSELVSQNFAVATVEVVDVLSGNIVEGDVVYFALPLTVELADAQLSAAAISTILYLEPFNPDTTSFEYPLLDRYDPSKVFIVPSPEGWIVEVTDTVSSLPLDHRTVDAPLSEFEPTDDGWPE